MDISNPNEFKVMKFKNISDFDFTPELGSMFDGRPIFISAGEEKVLPYVVADHLATNLAKQMLLRGYNASASAKQGYNETLRTIMTDEDIARIKSQILVEAYTEEKQATLSETDRLMNKVAELNAISDTPIVADGYKDKAEVIAELEKRNIKFDARQSKANLEKLLV